MIEMYDDLRSIITKYMGELHDWKENKWFNTKNPYMTLFFDKEDIIMHRDTFKDPDFVIFILKKYKFRKKIYNEVCMWAIQYDNVKLVKFILHNFHQYLDLYYKQTYLIYCHNERMQQLILKHFKIEEKDDIFKIDSKQFDDFSISNLIIAITVAIVTGLFISGFMMII